MNQNPNPPFLTGPQQIPLFPIYGYDNLEEAEHDFDYMKQLYPRDTRMIQDMIEDTCDRMEYEGSMMFDEYPDRLQVALMANKIYNQLAPSALGAQAISNQRPNRPAPPPQTLPWPPPPGRPGQRPPENQEPNWLRNMIEIMLCNEMCQRRRRYRSRRRWM